MHGLYFTARQAAKTKEAGRITPLRPKGRSLRDGLSMIQAQALARALNVLTKAPQFSYVKARAAARKDENVDWPRTKLANEGFNAEVDGCESFIMRDGSVCEWKPGAFTYTARAAR